MSFTFCFPCSTSSNCCSQRSQSSASRQSSSAQSPLKKQRTSDSSGYGTEIPLIFKPIRVDSPASAAYLRFPTQFPHPRPRQASPEGSTLNYSESLDPLLDGRNLQLSSTPSSYSISSLYGYDMNDEEIVRPLLTCQTESELYFGDSNSNSNNNYNYYFDQCRRENASVSPFFTSKSLKQLVEDQILQEEREYFDDDNFEISNNRSVDFLQLHMKHIDSETSSEISSCARKFGAPGTWSLKNRNHGRELPVSYPFRVVSLFEHKICRPEPYFKTCVDIEINPANNNNFCASDVKSSGSGQIVQKIPKYKGMQSGSEYKLFTNLIPPKFVQTQEVLDEIENSSTTSSTCTPTVQLSEIENIELEFSNSSLSGLPTNCTSTSPGGGEFDNYFSSTPSPNLSFFSNETRVLEEPDRDGNVQDEQQISHELQKIANEDDELTSRAHHSPTKFNSARIKGEGEGNPNPTALSTNGHFQPALDVSQQNAEKNGNGIVDSVQLQSHPSPPDSQCKMAIAVREAIVANSQRNPGFNSLTKYDRPNNRHISFELDNMKRQQVQAEVEVENSKEPKAEEIQPNKSSNNAKESRKPKSKKVSAKDAKNRSSKNESKDLSEGYGCTIYNIDDHFVEQSKKPIDIATLASSLHRIQQYLQNQDENIFAIVANLLSSPEFQQTVLLLNQIKQIINFTALPSPTSRRATNLHHLVQEECIPTLLNSPPAMRPESYELIRILNKLKFENLIDAHDQITRMQTMQYNISTEALLNGLPPLVLVVAAAVPSIQLSNQPDLLDGLTKTVYIEKTTEPLGVTVRNEDGKIMVGRIITGGTVEKCGLLHEGDEIVAINNVEMKGKSVNDICDHLVNLTGLLKFLLVPSSNTYEVIQLPNKERTVHVRANFNYDPSEDLFVPCRELGIGFIKGEILNVINQDDKNWWQAKREGEEGSALAGLIPSKAFQEQRETLKKKLLGGIAASKEKSSTNCTNAKNTLLCTKMDKKLKKKKLSKSTSFTGEDFIPDEILTYEEVGLYYPTINFKRPIVLIGPPNTGRHELRQLLLSKEPENFSAAIPHTSRTQKPDEIDGQDFHFITRTQFESDILSRNFVEYGEYEKSYYGTSLNSIQAVINSNKICILNLNPQSIKGIRTPRIKPYVVFVSPPSLERLTQIRLLRGESCKEDELTEIIAKARDVESKFGHYFDTVIVNNDIDLTYYELLRQINFIQREPQWVPTSWLTS